MNARTNELFAAVDAMQAEHVRYQNDDSLQYPPSSLWDAIEATLAVFDNGDIPHECKGLFNSAVTVSLQLKAHDETDEPSPPDSFWQAVEQLYATRKNMGRTVTKRRESMAELKEQKVPYEQIAQMFGLMDPDGRPQVDLVLKELATPGSVIGPDWVHPDDREADRNLAEANQRLHGTLSPKSKPKRDVCKETPRELFDQGVGVVQAANMLNVDRIGLEPQWAAWTEEKEAAEKAKDNPAPSTPPAPVVTTEGDEIDQLYKDVTVAAIREECSGKGITTRSSDTKAQLIAKLRAHAAMPKN